MFTEQEEFSDLLHFCFAHVAASILFDGTGEFPLPN
jgi:hypothetical protein